MSKNKHPEAQMIGTLKQLRQPKYLYNTPLLVRHFAGTQGAK